MIGPERTKPWGPVAMTGYGDAQRLVAGWTTKLTSHRANPHPTDTWGIRVGKSMPGRTVKGPNRHPGQIWTGCLQAACQKPEKPPEE